MGGGHPGLAASAARSEVSPINRPYKLLGRLNCQGDSMKKLQRPVLVFLMFVIVLRAQDATRGAALYKQQCGSCHGDRLDGRSGPSLGGADFQARFPTSELVAKIKNTMPQD